MIIDLNIFELYTVMIIMIKQIHITHLNLLLDFDFIFFSPISFYKTTYDDILKQ